ncbi:MAG TPA: hypothetical protein VHE37_16710, partial [Nevskiaceae bacterium]|nr:hypothetical protein [Nevskiaceae bacterium]
MDTQANNYRRLVVATIAESIEPQARAAKYEEPLAQALQRAGAGIVAGGGSQLDAAMRVSFVDIE